MNSLRVWQGLLVAAILLATSLGSAPAQPGIVVEGQVVNATPGGGSVAGLTVVLHQQGAEEHRDLETVTDAQGRFRFEGIVPRPGFLYGVSVQYQGALYGQELDLSSGPPSPLSITVYEATDREEVLSVSSMSVLFSDVDKATQTIGVLEIVTLVNTSERSYVPGPQPMKLLRFSLPAGFQDLRVQSRLLDSDVLQVDRGFALTGSVPPGEHEVMYAYRFPYSGTQALFVRSLPYGAGRLRVLAPQGLLRLSGSSAGVFEEVAIGGRSYWLTTYFDLPRGSQLTLALSGLPRASLWDRAGRLLQGIPFEYAGPVGLGLLAMGLLIFKVRYHRRRRELTARLLSPRYQKHGRGGP